MADRYRRLSVEIWRDPDFRALSDYQMRVFLYVLTTPRGNGCGLFELSLLQAMEDIHGTLEQTFDETLWVTFQGTFQRVCETFSWKYCRTSRVMYIPSWWKWNAPANPNTLAKLLKAFDRVPKSELDHLFFNNLDHLSEGMRKRMAERYAKRYPERFSERYPEPPPEHREQGTGNREQGTDTNSYEALPSETAREAGQPKSEERAISDLDTSPQEELYETLAYLSPNKQRLRSAESEISRMWAVIEAKGVEEVIAIYRAWCDSEQWSNARFAPQLPKWIKEHRWDDGLPPEPKSKTGSRIRVAATGSQAEAAERMIQNV